MQCLNFCHMSNLVNQKYLVMLMLNLWGFFFNQHGALILERLTSLFCLVFLKPRSHFDFNSASLVLRIMQTKILVCEKLKCLEGCLVSCYHLTSITRYKAERTFENTFLCLIFLDIFFYSYKTRRLFCWSRNL